MIKRLDTLYHRLGIIILLCVVSLLTNVRSEAIFTFSNQDSVPNSPAGTIPASYERRVNLPSSKVRFSPPALGDLDHHATNDLEIVVGTEDGWIHAIRADGSILWSYQTRHALNALAEVSTNTTIRSAPCLADLDGDGWLEVIVSIGEIGVYNENGGVVVLDHDGNLLPGWPALTSSIFNDLGITEGVVSSPAVGDLDNDGLLEIVFGAFDARVYAYRMDGTLLTGWPRFLHDTIWSSPVIADLNNDGFSEIIIGSDSHYDPYWGFQAGGYLHVLNYQGQEANGFPRHVPQTIYSSPAIADLDSDGFLDIIVGTGTFYGGTGGYQVSAWNYLGNSLPGWPVSTGGNVPGSPAVGDIDGDGDLEVVVGAHDNKIWAWHHNGTVKWSRTPKDYTGASRTQSSVILADYDNDGRLEVFSNFGWEVGILDQDGSQITWDGSEPNPGKLTYLTDHTLDSPSAVSDIDNDGYLELVAAGGYNGGASGRIYVWQLPQPQTHQVADWAMFRKDAIHSARQGSIPEYDAVIVAADVPDVVPQSHLFTWQVTVKNSGTQPWVGGSWGLSGYNPTFTPETFIPLSPSETVQPGETKTFAFSVVTPISPGFHPLSWRMTGPVVGSFGAKFFRELKIGQEPALYVFAKEENPLWSQSIYAGGIAPALGPVSSPLNFSYGRAMAMRPDGQGYYLLTRYGTLHWGGSAPDFGGWATLSSQDLVIAPDGNGIYRLGNKGQIDQTAGLPRPGPQPEVPNARSLAITQTGRGAYILDSYGLVHRRGTAPSLLPATPTFSSEIAKRIKLTADQTGYYVLDAYGRVHAGGSAAPIEPNYAPDIGEDSARDFDLTQDGLGYFLLDKYGEIHTGGTAVPPTIKIPPIWTSDTALDIEVVNGLQLTEPYLGPHTPPITFLIDLDGGGIWSRSFSLDNYGWGGTLTWSASAAPTVDWLDIQPPAGQTPGQVKLEISSLPPGGVGTYTTSLIVEGYLESHLVDTIETTVRVVVVEDLSTVHLPLIAR